MATALQGFRLTARSCHCALILQRVSTPSIPRRKPFTTTQIRPKIRRSEVQEVMGKLEESLGFDIEEELASDQDELEEMLEDDDETVYGHPAPALEGNKKKLKETFLNMGEPEPYEEDGGFDEDNHDDLPSLAHEELEQHREWRHYARLAAWEMPLLTKLAKPFEPPTADMPLRFRYTTYMGEHHPAEKKVVLEFCPADMPGLTTVQRDKLKKLCGVRYDPQQDIVHMSCESYESQAQNKRYLGDLVDTLLKEARDPTDTFEDVALDTRHHRFRSKPHFPKEWVLTDQRREELAQYRLRAQQKDQQLAIRGQILDGLEQIAKVQTRRPANDEAVAELVMAGAKPKGKTVAVRR